VVSKFSTREELYAYRDKVWANEMREFGDFKFLWITGGIWYHGKHTTLTQTEAEMLLALINKWPNAIRARDMGRYLSTRTLQGEDDAKVMAYRIRAKLREDLGIPNLLVTTSRGYIFFPESVM
jgi:DNA-binding response OmpR family regulator